MGERDAVGEGIRIVGNRVTLNKYFLALQDSEILTLNFTANNTEF